MRPAQWKIVVLPISCFVILNINNPFCCAEEQLYSASISSSFGKPEIRHLIVFIHSGGAYRGASKAAIVSRDDLIRNKLASHNSSSMHQGNLKVRLRM
jgi:hypothetical protein